MEREIKFKFWLGHTKKMTCEHTLIEIAHLHWDFTEDIIPLQYAGLKDKSGKDIYEGDILTCETKRYLFPNKGVVCFINGYFGINVGPSLESDKDEYAHFWNNQNFEIIGNIYESPELLNK